MACLVTAHWVNGCALSILHAEVVSGGPRGRGGAADAGQHRPPGADGARGPRPAPHRSRYRAQAASDRVAVAGANGLITRYVTQRQPSEKKSHQMIGCFGFEWNLDNMEARGTLL